MTLEGRSGGFLAELKRNRDGERGLLLGHAATRLAIEVVAGQRLEELLVEQYKWQPGWEYVL